MNPPISSARRRLITIVAAIIAPLGLAAAVAAPADAATHATIATAPSHASGGSRIVFTRTSAASAARPDTTISCTVFANEPTWWPAGSLKSYTAVEGTGAVNCTGFVTEIVLTTGLAWDGGETFTSGPQPFPDTTTAEVNLVTDCEVGNWIAGAIATIYAPPGYTPSSFTIEATSDPLTLGAC